MLMLCGPDLFLLRVVLMFYLAPVVLVMITAALFIIVKNAQRRDRIEALHIDTGRRSG